MTARPRRSVRGTKSASAAAEAAHVSELPASDQSAAESRCPACKTTAKKEEDDSDVLWVRCDQCRTWYHWDCVSPGGDLDVIDKWYCNTCHGIDPRLAITFKPPARKSARKRTQRDYANMHEGRADGDPHRWRTWMGNKPIVANRFRRMHGSEVNMEWIANDENAMTEPIVVERPDDLGMQMPSGEFSVEDVVNAIGGDTPVEVIDVTTQSTAPGWNLAKWGEYYGAAPDARDKIRNVISLEVSNTPLAEQVSPPRLVRDLDWVEKFWPSNKKGKTQVYPKVQLYCLMGVEDAWTDWHIDFAGSSVYYHIVKGEKVFFFIRPTSSNLAAYEKWCGSDAQSSTWLGDMADEVQKVHLVEGNTMIIPTGWIHAVYTPRDALVFGGNFLHSYNIQTQLRVREIETTTRVPKKFQFPLFTKLCWYVGEKYYRDVKAKEEFSMRVLEGVSALAEYLVGQVRVMERGSEAARREAKEHVPTERVKEPAVVARELRWRVRLAMGVASDDENGRRVGANGLNGATKRRRRDSPSETIDGTPFRHFRPKPWDHIERQTNSGEPQTVHIQRLEADRLAKVVDDGMDAGEEEAELESRTEDIKRVRQYEDKGGTVVERQTVRITLSRWTLASQMT